MPLDYNEAYPQGMVALNDPTTLLLPEPDRKDWRKNFVFPLIGGIIGFCCPGVKNWYINVPLRTGILQYPAFIGIGLVAGKLIEDYRDKYHANRDAHFRQYIRNHPEDFQPLLHEERKKVGDLLKPWVPIR